MKTVHTVCGPVNPDQLGFTHTHEHILCDARMTHRTEPPTRGAYMLLDDCERAVIELRKFSELGGGGMVELTTAAWGRDIKVLRRISSWVVKRPEASEGGDIGVSRERLPRPW